MHVGRRVDCEVPSRLGRGGGGPAESSGRVKADSRRADVPPEIQMVWWIGEVTRGSDGRTAVMKVPP
jgi:hypothetical protein